jgi:AraC-like DNA-binding protein
MELTSLSFDDIDHMVEFSKQIGWDNIGTQLTPGENRISYNYFSLPNLSIAHYCVEQSIHNVFELPKGIVVFLICRTRLPLVWCGRELPPTLIGIARSGMEHDVVLKPGWDCYEFILSETFIRNTEIFPLDFYEKTWQFEKSFLPLSGPINERFLQELDIIFQLNQAKNMHEPPSVNEVQFHDFIVHRLLQLIDAGLRMQGPQHLKSIRRPELVSNAREFVSANLTREISIASLAETLGVSERVLNYAFKEMLGISPYQYLLTQKLHAVRRALKSTPVTVSDACYSYGFQTPSRFARQYARHFGELPSTTKNKQTR